ncbi:hypothetical protein PLICRDRAFT_51527 [Plicaturopsis crispa FD-325 SS-3]|nr:hypothetical protein PLICRDRAFT_51527 [Plicaturopsis crispa FD-325 SS-3]
MFSSLGSSALPNARPQYTGSAKQVSKSFPFGLFKVPSLSSNPYAVAAKLDTGYRPVSTSDTWHNAPWLASRRNGEKSVTPLTREISTRDTSLHNTAAVEAGNPPPEMVRSRSLLRQGRIIAGASKNSYIYERSISSLSDFQSSDSNTDAASLSSVSTSQTAALANSSTTTLNSLALTESPSETTSSMPLSSSAYSMPQTFPVKIPALVDAQTSTGRILPRNSNVNGTAPGGNAQSTTLSLPRPRHNSGGDHYAASSDSDSSSAGSIDLGVAQDRDRYKRLLPPGLGGVPLDTAPRRDMTPIAPRPSLSSSPTGPRLETSRSNSLEGITPRKRSMSQSTPAPTYGVVPQPMRSRTLSTSKTPVLDSRLVLPVPPSLPKLETSHLQEAPPGFVSQSRAQADPALRPIIPSSAGPREGQKPIRPLPFPPTTTHRRTSDGDQFVKPATILDLPPTSAPPETHRDRSVRWNENLICPSPIRPHQRRKGWFNRRGDQLWTNEGAYKPPASGDEFPLDLAEYPEPGQGWQNEEGVRIDTKHRLIPKQPLRSALKNAHRRATA